MNTQTHYDVAIIGAGMSGLAAAVQAVLDRTAVLTPEQAPGALVARCAPPPGTTLSTRTPPAQRDPVGTKNH